MSKAAMFLSVFTVIYFLPACIAQRGERTTTSVAAYPRVMEKARKSHRTLIMHSGIDTFQVTSMQVEKNKQEFTVHLNKLDSLLRGNISNQKGSRLHIFMLDSVSYTLDEPHTIPFSKVARVESVN